ncbi:MAG: hypothetical protein ACI4VQ_03495, partial [Clostridia bacterium]
MDKQIVNTDEKDNEVLEEQRILEDAENIIATTTREIRYEKNKKYYLLVVLPILILLILLLVLSTIFAIVNANNSTILNGISIQGIDVSNLTIEEAKSKVSTVINEHLSKEITAFHNDYEMAISTNQFSVSFDVNSAVDEAYAIGRSGNIFEHNFSIL